MSSSTAAAAGAPESAGVLVAAMESALDRLGDEVLGGSVGDGELAASVEALHRVETRVRAEKLRRVAEVDRRRAYASQGCRSTVEWLARRLGLTRGEAGRQADTAVKLERLPATAARFRQGELGSGQADTAARMLDELTFDDDPAGGGARDGDGHSGGGAGDGDDGGDGSGDGAGADNGAGDGEGAGEGERGGDGAGEGERGGDGAGEGERDGGGGAGGGDGGGEDSGLGEFDEFVSREGAKGDRGRLRRRVSEWQHERDREWLADRDRALFRRRGCGVRTEEDGSVRLDARLDPLGGARVRTALDALSRPAGGDDARSAEQRRADALVELADRYLAEADRPDTAASRPQVLLVTPAPTGEGRAPATVDGYGPVSAATAAQAGCDAETTIVTVDRDGDVLDAGRARRAPSTRQRAAVIARDRRCVGCGGPISRCDIHHIRPWSQGGATDLANLVAVCWSCHHHIHHHHWRVGRGPDGRYTLHPPRPAPGRASGPDQTRSEEQPHGHDQPLAGFERTAS